MKYQSKSNNFIAVLIALMLFAAGFILFFLHEQSESDEKQKPAKAVTMLTNEATPARRHSVAT